MKGSETKTMKRDIKHLNGNNRKCKRAIIRYNRNKFPVVLRGLLVESKVMKVLFSPIAEF